MHTFSASPAVTVGPCWITNGDSDTIIKFVPKYGSVQPDLKRVHFLIGQLSSSEFWKKLEYPFVISPVNVSWSIA